LRKNPGEKRLPTKINTEKERLPNIVAVAAFCFFCFGLPIRKLKRSTSAKEMGRRPERDSETLELDFDAAHAQLLYKMCAANESEISERSADQRKAQSVQKASEVKG